MAARCGGDRSTRRADGLLLLLLLLGEHLRRLLPPSLLLGLLHASAWWRPTLARRARRVAAATAEDAQCASSTTCGRPARVPAALDVDGRRAPPSLCRRVRSGDGDAHRLGGAAGARRAGRGAGAVRRVLQPAARRATARLEGRPHLVLAGPHAPGAGAGAHRDALVLGHCFLPPPRTAAASAPSCARPSTASTSSSSLAEQLALAAAAPPPSASAPPPSAAAVAANGTISPARALLLAASPAAAARAAAANPARAAQRVVRVDAPKVRTAPSRIRVASCGLIGLPSTKVECDDLRLDAVEVAVGVVDEGGALARRRRVLDRKVARERAAEARIDSPPTSGSRAPRRPSPPRASRACASAAPPSSAAARTRCPRGAASSPARTRRALAAHLLAPLGEALLEALVRQHDRPRARARARAPSPPPTPRASCARCRATPSARRRASLDEHGGAVGARRLDRRVRRGKVLLDVRLLDVAHVAPRVLGRRDSATPSLSDGVSSASAVTHRVTLRWRAAAARLAASERSPR